MQKTNGKSAINPVNDCFISNGVNPELAKVGLIERAELASFLNECFDKKTSRNQVIRNGYKVTKNVDGKSVTIIDLEECNDGIGLYEVARVIELNEDDRIKSVYSYGNVIYDKLHSLRIPAVLEFEYAEDGTPKCTKAEGYAHGDQITTEEFLRRRSSLYMLSKKCCITPKHITMTALELSNEIKKRVITHGSEERSLVH